MITRIALAGSVAFALMTWLSLREAYIHKGEAKAVAKVVKNNDIVRKKANAAAAKSVDPKSRGVRNPHYRDN